MPAEQRIIGGGLLVAGVSIVLILIWFFTQGGMSPREAHDKLLDEVFPAWLEADSEGDYLGQRKAAEQALDVIEEGGRNGIVKFLQGSPTDDRAKRLLKAIEDGTFEKNAEGRYEFDGGWFVPEDHKEFFRLKYALEGVRILNDVRALARNTREAVALARVASGMPLEFGPEKPVPTDGATTPDATPIHSLDAELFRVFGTSGGDLEKALATAYEGATGTTQWRARERWNNEIVKGDLSSRVSAIPETAAGLLKKSADLVRAARALEASADAKGKLRSFLERTVAVLAAGLEGDAKQAVEGNRAAFADGGVLAAILQREAEMLDAYRGTVHHLEKAFTLRFK